MRRPFLGSGTQAVAVILGGVTQPFVDVGVPRHGDDLAGGASAAPRCLYEKGRLTAAVVHNLWRIRGEVWL